VLDSTIALQSVAAGADGKKLLGGGSAQGGGIYLANATATLSNATVSDNNLESGAGQVYQGAGVYAAKGLLSMTSSTITSNDMPATGQGGGLFQAGTSSVTLKNTIVAGNALDNDVSGAVTADSSFNLIGNGAGLTGITAGLQGNQIGGAGGSSIDPMLGPLDDNGGATPTHALLPGSFAIDAGTNNGSPSIDQRGVLRPQNGIADIGAFEAAHTDVVALPPGGGTYTLLADSGYVSLRQVGGPELFRRATNSVSPLEIDGSNGDDTLIVDFSGGNPIPVDGLAFTGQGRDSANDKLMLAGTAGDVTYSLATSSSGEIDIDGAVVSFSGLQPVLDNLTATHRTFAFGDSADSVILSDGALSHDGVSELALAGQGAAVSFAKLTGSLTIAGGGGDDTLTLVSIDALSTASIIVDGGDDDDLLNANGLAHSASLTGGTGDDTIVGGTGADSISGGDGNDNLRGGGGNDRLSGDDGLDLIFGGTGNDLLDGGADDDTLQGQGGNDSLKGGAGIDLVVEAANADFLLSDSQLVGSGVDQLAEIEQARLTGGAGANLLNANAFTGAATLLGLGGDDRLFGGSGDDLLDGGDGDDTLAGGTGDDRLVASVGRDLLAGNDGADILLAQGNVSPVTLRGEAGDDTLLNGMGADSLDGGDGNDVFVTNQTGFQQLMGGPGLNVLQWTAGTLDLTSLAAGQATGIDVVDLHGNGPQHLVLNAAAVLNLAADAATLRVDRDADDSIDMGAGWTFTGTQLLDGEPYAAFSQSGVGLLLSTFPQVLTLPSGGGVYEMLVDSGDLVVRRQGGAELLRISQAVAGSLTIDGSAEDDALIVDFSHGNPIPAGGLTFNGLGGTVHGNTLTLAGGVAGRVTQTFANAHDGQLTIDDRSISYTGLEPVMDKLTAADRVLVFGDSADAITVSDGAAPGDGVGRVSIAGAGELVDFRAPTNSLTIDAGGGDDTVSLSSVDALWTAAIFVNGQDGNDQFAASSLAQGASLSGGAGEDVFSLGARDDSLDGGEGIDRVEESADVNFVLSDTHLTGLGGNPLHSIERARLSGGAGANVIDAQAFSGSVILTGLGGADTLFGGAGNDDLFGGGGKDLLDGGGGDDRLTGQGGDDTLNGGTGFNRLVESASGSFVLTDSQLTGAGIDQLSEIEAAQLNAGAGDDTLDATGFSGDVTLYGGAGSDKLLSGGGQDSLSGGKGNDTLDAGAGNDTLSGSLDDDSLVGGDGDDQLVESKDVSFVLTDSQMTGLGNDSLSGIESAELTAGDSDNTLDASGFSGSVTLLGGAGNDRLVGAAGSDILIAGAGRNTLIGGAGDDLLAGEDDVDSLNGQSGADTLLGGARNDTLLGGAGNDLLLGEAGSDFVIGQGGVDTVAGGGNGLTGEPSDTVQGENIDDAFLFDSPWLHV
jgi:Ca2+-binding RTX toxin-like protein